MLKQKFGQIPLSIEQKIKQLHSNQLDDLAFALLQFSQWEDLRRWLEH